MSASTETRVPEPAKRKTSGWSQSLHDWVTTVDHKRLGILYISAGFFFLVIGFNSFLRFRFFLLVISMKTCSFLLSRVMGLF